MGMTKGSPNPNPRSERGREEVRTEGKSNPQSERGERELGMKGERNLMFAGERKGKQETSQATIGVFFGGAGGGGVWAGIIT